MVQVNGIHKGETMKDKPIVKEFNSEELSDGEQLEEFLSDVRRCILNYLTEPRYRQYKINVTFKPFTKDTLWELYLQDKVEIKP